MVRKKKARSALILDPSLSLSPSAARALRAMRTERDRHLAALRRQGLRKDWIRTCSEVIDAFLLFAVESGYRRLPKVSMLALPVFCYGDSFPCKELHRTDRMWIVAKFIEDRMSKRYRVRRARSRENPSNRQQKKGG